MSQHDFDKLVQKYLAGQSSPDEEQLMRDWSERMLESSTIGLNSAEKQATQQRIWKRIYRGTLHRPLFRGRYGWFGIRVVAATILLLLLAGLFVWQPSTIQKTRPLVARKRAEPQGTVTIKNALTKPQKITLKDGSFVVLSAKSSLSYPERFGDKTRQVYLQGEASFDVRHDPARPFIVRTGALVTQVLGTQFTVKSYDDASAIEVLVTRGRVSVYEASARPSQGRNGVILMPNQKITFDKSSQKLTPGLIEIPQMVQPPENRTSFVFDRTPLVQVLNTLRDVYGIEFIVENQSLSRCAFTGDINELPLYVQLDLICKSLNSSYERRGTTLFIQGEGCPE